MLAAKQSILEAGVACARGFSDCGNYLYDVHALRAVSEKIKM